MVANTNDNFFASLNSGSYLSLRDGDQLTQNFAPPALDLDTSELFAGIPRATVDAWTTARNSHKAA